jgi:PPM family protein phosphatase
VKVQVATRTLVGARRRNEDDLRCGQLGQRTYAVLADGAGGHANGAVAADLTVRSVSLGLQSAPCFDAATLDRCVAQAHDAVRAATADASGQAMHATVVALWLEGEQALWTNVGDSRLYRVRAGRASQLSHDDSLVQQLVDAGLIDEAAARQHPHKNQLVCAMGMDAALKPHTTPQASRTLEGDAYLLCSDGWWEHTDADFLASTLQRATTCEAWLDLMRNHIERQAAPQQDNFSAIGVWLGEPADVTRAM